MIKSAFFKFSIELCFFWLLFICLCISSVAPPQFTSNPPSQISVREGGNLSLKASASGNPTPNIKWSVQGKNGKDQSRYMITAEQFEIREVRFEDQGIITCRAENVFGFQETKVELIVFGEVIFILWISISFDNFTCLVSLNGLR